MEDRWLGYFPLVVPLRSPWEKIVPKISADKLHLTFDFRGIFSFHARIWFMCYMMTCIFDKFSGNVVLRSPVINPYACCLAQSESKPFFRVGSQNRKLLKIFHGIVGHFFPSFTITMSIDEVQTDAYALKLLWREQCWLESFKVNIEANGKKSDRSVTYIERGDKSQNL